MNIVEKLLQLGFELKEEYFNTINAYVFRTSREDRNNFVHDFVYYPDENQFYINCHLTRHTETITEDKLMQDHNNLNTPAKNKWLEIKEELKGYEFKVYSK